MTDDPVRRWLGMWYYRIAESASVKAEPILGWRRAHEWLCPFCRGMERALHEMERRDAWLGQP